MYPSQRANWIRITRWYLIRVMMVCCVLQEYCDVNENLPNLPLCRFLMPLPSFLVSLSPSSCASLSSSPCNSSLLSLCSPYNQVFFMLFCKVPCESVPRSSSVSLFFTFSPPFHLLPSSILPMSRLEEMCPCQEGTAIYGQYQFIVRGFMYWPVASANLIHYFLHSGHYFGVAGQK